MAVTSLAHRLVSIINYLSGGNTINIHDLSIEFSISQRQIQKDIELFKGIYEVESLGNQNYRIKDGFKLYSASNENLDISLSLLKSLQSSAMPQMSPYIDSSLPEIKEYKNMFILDIAYEEITHTDEFYKLIKAIKSQESCSFLYTKKDTSSKQVYVHPYRLANFSNFWYLLAYDVESKKLKSYHINSIKKVLFANENYISNITVEKEIEDTFAKFNSVWFDGNPKSINLEIVGNAKLYIQRNVPKQAYIIQETDSKLLMQLHYYNSAEVISFVKQWLPEVTILNNDKIKTELKDILQKSLKNL